MMFAGNHRSAPGPISGGSARRSRAERLWDAWAFAAMEAELALEVWNKTKHDLKAAAFATYRAALDREEQAAAILAARIAADAR
jgi:hypothetical protein